MKALYPYDTLFGDVTLRVTDVEVDEMPLYGRVDADRREIDLTGIERKRWERARLEVAVSGPASELKSRRAPTAVAVLNCGPSNTRHAVTLQADESSPGRWSGAVELDREGWYGRAELRVVITATEQGVPHRIIGTADVWTVSFDDLPRGPVTGSITIRWTDFASPEDDAPYLTHFATDPWYLRIDPDVPTLFLNRGFQGLEALLMDRRRRPPSEQALHDHARASLAAGVWTSLFNASLDAVEVEVEEGDIQWPPEEWQRAALTALLGRMYENRSMEDALNEALIARRSPDGAAALHERLMAASAAQVSLPRLLRDGIRILSDEPEDVEESL